MTFKIDASMDGINLKDDDIADVRDESIEKFVEVIQRSRSHQDSFSEEYGGI